MPIVGCYDLHLYCDGIGCAVGMFRERAEFEANDESGSACRAAARKRGWRLDLKAQTALCPACVKSGNKVEVDSRWQVKPID